MKRLLFCLLIGGGFQLPAASLAQESTIVAQCQKLKSGIARYDQLRRDGGSGARMDAWKRERRTLEKQYRKLGCKYHRWKWDD